MFLSLIFSQSFSFPCLISKQNEQIHNLYIYFVYFQSLPPSFNSTHSLFQSFIFSKYPICYWQQVLNLLLWQYLGFWILTKTTIRYLQLDKPDISSSVWLSTVHCLMSKQFYKNQSLILLNALSKQQLSPILCCSWSWH